MNEEHGFRLRSADWRQFTSRMVILAQAALLVYLLAIAAFADGRALFDFFNPERSRYLLLMAVFLGIAAYEVRPIGEDLLPEEEEWPAPDSDNAAPEKEKKAESETCESLPERPLPPARGSNRRAFRVFPGGEERAAAEEPEAEPTPQNYTAAVASYVPAMLAAGEEAIRVHAIVEAYYCFTMAALRGAEEAAARLTFCRAAWLSAGCPDEDDGFLEGFTEDRMSMGLAALNYDTAIDRPGAVGYLLEAASLGDPDAIMFLLDRKLIKDIELREG